MYRYYYSELCHEIDISDVLVLQYVSLNLYFANIISVMPFFLDISKLAWLDRLDTVVKALTFLRSQFCDCGFLLVLMFT